MAHFYQRERGEAFYGPTPCRREGCASVSEPSPVRNWTKNCAGTGNLWGDAGCRSTRISGRGCDRRIGPCGNPWSHVLIPRAEIAREILPEQLRELGATVEVIPVYRTIVPAVAVVSLTQQLHDGRVAA